MQKKLLSVILGLLFGLSLLTVPAQTAGAQPTDLSQWILVDDLPYDSAYALEGNYISVAIDTDGDGKAEKGLIDSTGKEIISPIYDFLEMSDGMVIVGQDTDNNAKTGVKNTGVDKYGVFDLQGNQVVPLKYDRMENFYDGLAAVYMTVGVEGSLIKVEKELVGFIDKTGKEVIPVQYTINELGGLEVWQGDGYSYRAGFSDGVVCLYKDGTGNGKVEVVIDTQGNIVFERNLENGFCSSFRDGLAMVRLNGKKGYIDKHGNMVIPAEYDMAHDFSEGYAVVGKKNVNGEMLYGAIDQKGNVVVPLIYHGMTPFCEGMARVYKQDETKSTYANKYGFVDTTGKLVVPMIYASAENYSKGMAVVSVDDERFEDFQRRYGCIDKSGNVIIPLDYSTTFEFSDGIAYVCVGYPSGVSFDRDYPQRIYARFKELGINSECSCINVTGETVISFGDRGENYLNSPFSGKVGVYKKLNGKYAIIQNPCYKEGSQTTTPINTPEKAQLTAAQTAAPTQSTVLVNGKSISFDAYSINDNNYFKLRDLAKALSGTEKQFEVTWDREKQAIDLLSNKPYTAVGGELAKGDGTRKTALPSTSEMFLDGKAVQLTAYTINGNNYFKLRDIGETFDFFVDWDGAKNTIIIDTANGYTNVISGYEVTEPLPQNAGNNPNSNGGGTSYLNEVKYLDFEANALASNAGMTLAEWIPLHEDYCRAQCEKYGWTDWDKYVKDNVEAFDRWR
ncbi:MAG: WG repeat-containing protein [Oscillospiraceae bacterium]|nr:WG repeat-containing protein [Oscillospiraceae bacterium]